MQIGERLLVDSGPEWRTWLSKHGAELREIWLIFYKKSSSRAGISYDAAVEEALCFGWIDGQMRSIDVDSYAIRFTPRHPRGAWSASNRARVTRLLQEGRMTDAGLAVLPPDIDAQ
jgi:uncharacterized protein YdeI (YjbR/CyaY-like superfamily)